MLGHIHGSELLMLEQIAAGPPPGWDHAEQWVERICEWAAGCERIVVNSPEGRKRAAACSISTPSASSWSRTASTRTSARSRSTAARTGAGTWSSEPQGWRRAAARQRRLHARRTSRRSSGTTLLYSGRFTEVKRLTLLIEAYAEARARFARPTALVLLGGYPGEWEGEHPDRDDRAARPRRRLPRRLARPRELPDFLAATDLIVHASVREQFGQVLVEAMACGVPPIAVDRGGPATIVDDGRTGWLVEPDDRRASSRRWSTRSTTRPSAGTAAAAAREEAVRRYTWAAIGAALAGELAEILADRITLGASASGASAGGPGALDT